MQLCSYPAIMAGNSSTVKITFAIMDASTKKTMVFCLLLHQKRRIKESLTQSIILMLRQRSPPFLKVRLYFKYLIFQRWRERTFTGFRSKSCIYRLKFIILDLNLPLFNKGTIYPLQKNVFEY